MGLTLSPPLAANECWQQLFIMKEFQEFADRLKEVENQKRQRVKFCQQHNFGEEVRWLQKQLVIISEIRMEMEMVANGHRKPSEATFVDL